MKRFPGIVALTLALLAWAGPAPADSVALVMELEGTLSKGRAGYTLSVADEGLWSLDLPEGLRALADRTLRKYDNAKVALVGRVRVRSFGGPTLQLRDRTVQVTVLEPLAPAMKVKSVLVGSPAAGGVKPGDLILEVQGEAVGSLEHLIQVLDKNRGKAISLVVTRGGSTKLVEGITLRRFGQPLGITVETVWSRQANVAPVGPPPGSEPKEKVLPSPRRKPGDDT